jgi:hypothetical protein
MRQKHCQRTVTVPIYGTASTNQSQNLNYVETGQAPTTGTGITCVPFWHCFRSTAAPLLHLPSGQSRIRRRRRPCLCSNRRRRRASNRLVDRPCLVTESAAGLVSGSAWRSLASGTVFSCACLPTVTVSGPSIDFFLWTFFIFRWEKKDENKCPWLTNYLRTVLQLKIFK